MLNGGPSPGGARSPGREARRGRALRGGGKVGGRSLGRILDVFNRRATKRTGPAARQRRREPFNTSLLGLREVECIAEICGDGIARAERCQVEAVLYEREDRRSVIHRGVDETLLGEWREHERGDASARAPRVRTDRRRGSLKSSRSLARGKSNRAPDRRQALMESRMGCRGQTI